MAVDPPAPPPRRRLSLNLLLGLGLTGLGAVAPVLAEAEAHAQLDSAGLEPRLVDLDLAGLELHGLTQTLPGGRLRIEFERVRVRPGFDGVHIDIEGMRARPVETSPTANQPETKPATPSSSSRSASKDPLAELLHRVRGIPIEIEHHGSVELRLDADLWVRAEDIRIELPGDGRIEAEAHVALATSEGAPSWINAELELDGHDSAPRELGLRGQLAGPSGGPQLSVSGQLSAETPSFDLRLADGLEGHARVRARPTRVELDAERMPLETLEPLFARALARVENLTHERGSTLGLADAIVSGHIELERQATRTLAHFDNLELRGLELDADLLSSEPLALDPLTVDGELGQIEDPELGRRRYASVVLGHHGVQAALEAELDDHGLRFDLDVPETPCQALLDATPGLPAVVAGTELSGQLAAHFGLDLDFAELADARARYLGDDPLAFDLDAFDPPGELRFSLPYLEACEVTRLGPGIDIEGLAGPYRHDFVDAEGRATRRVLAPGDRGYVSLGRVPQLALAFVILEDALFRRHDGFDREQIERAFWFNLLEGRVSRGASTITQQTARTLWLGVDRSVSRKLAEAMLAAELERGLDKRRILEVYLNLIELGPGVHGIADAARFHFGKAPEDLSLIQALHLASLAPAPVTYSKRFADGHVDAAWRDHLRRQVRRLQIRHLVTAEVAQEAMRLRLQLRQR